MCSLNFDERGRAIDPIARPESFAASISYSQSFGATARGAARMLVHGKSD